MARRSAVGNISRKLSTKARNSARQSVYVAMWGEEPPKGKKRVK